jgi:hypothetical protein
MSKIVSIIRRNQETFYNFDTTARQPTWPRIFLTVGVAAVLALSFREQSDQFLTAVLSAQAILVGFSFSVMFYILNGTETPHHGRSLEAELREERLTQLGKELFYNVSYFNLVAISCVVSALLLLAGMDHHGPIAWIPDAFFGSLEGKIWQVSSVLRVILYGAFYFLIIESIYTFVRTTARVTFYFERRLNS